MFKKNKQNIFKKILFPRNKQIQIVKKSFKKIHKKKQAKNVKNL